VDVRTFCILICTCDSDSDSDSKGKDKYKYRDSRDMHSSAAQHSTANKADDAILLA